MTDISEYNTNKQNEIQQTLNFITKVCKNVILEILPFIRILPNFDPF